MLDLFCFLATLIVLIYSGWRNVRKVDNESSYLIANRKTGLFALTATLVMTEFNPSTLLGFSGPGYAVGLRALLLPLVFLIGLGFYTIVVSRLWKRFNALSVAELFSQRYGQDIGKLTSIFLILAMLGFSATYVKSLILIFLPLVPQISAPLLGGFLILVVLLMTLRGGLVAIISTDVLSFVGTLIIIPLIFYFSYSHSQIGWQGLEATFPAQKAAQLLPGRFVISLIVLTVFTYIAAPWYGQKIFAASSERIAFIAVALSSLIVFLLYAFPALGVAFLKVENIPIQSGESGVPTILDRFFPAGIRGFAYAILFSAGATTLAGVWSAMTTMVIGDFLQPAGALGYRRGFLISLAFSLITYLLSITLVDSVLNKLILANIPVFALSFALLAGFYWPKANRKAAIVSILIGFFWGIYCYLHYGEQGGYTWYWSIYGIMMIFASGILTSILLPMSPAEKQRTIAFFTKLSASKIQEAD